MTLIDGDRIITAQLYNDEYEEFTEEKMSIIDYINCYTTEGVTETDVVMQTRWIPVSERLPEPNTLVLCYVTTGATETYFLALWNDIQNAWEEGIGGYRFLEYDLEYEVIAWMPLPEPYKEVQDESKS